jgi:hypothetical protein
MAAYRWKGQSPLYHAKQGRDNSVAAAGATGFGDSGHRGTTGRGEARRWNDRSRDPRRESLTRAAPRKDTAELAPAAAISCSCPASAIPRLLSHRALADQIQAARATLSPTSSQLGRPAASGSAGGTAGRVPCMIGRSLDRSVLRLPLAGRDREAVAPANDAPTAILREETSGLGEGVASTAWQ